MAKPSIGLAVDGFCKGNPGFGGYRGIDLETGEQVFYCELKHCTNNIAEFIGLVHALMFAKKNSRQGGKQYHTIYTDSQVAISWFEKKDAKTSCEPDIETKERLRKCLMWLLENKSLAIVAKWETDQWGEIPADFGHKK